MSKTGGHAEDIEHELEHAGRDVADHFVEAVGEPENADESALVDSADE